jgi:CHAT domain-containing protein/tetratricopeptide (TPR) repeat protein
MKDDLYLRLNPITRIANRIPKKLWILGVTNLFVFTFLLSKYSDLSKSYYSLFVGLLALLLISALTILGLDLTKDIVQAIFWINKRALLRSLVEYRHARAIEQARWLLSFSERHMDGDHRICESMLMLASLYATTGDFASADSLYRRAQEQADGMRIAHDFPLSVYTRIFKDFMLSGILSVRAHFLMGIEDIVSARECISRAIEIEEAALSSSGRYLFYVARIKYQRRFATTLALASAISRKHGDFAIAERYADRAIEIWQECRGNQLQIVECLINLARLKNDTGNSLEAERLINQAIAACRENRVTNQKNAIQPIMHYAQSNLGRIYCSTGRFDDAESLFRKAVVGLQDLLGPRHHHVAQVLIALATCQAMNSRGSGALSLLIQAEDIHDQIMANIFSLMSNRQREAFLTSIRRSFEVFLSLVLQQFTTSAQATGEALDLVLKRKALGAEVAMLQLERALGGKHPGLQRKLSELISLRMQIAQTMLAGLHRVGSGNRGQLSREIERRREELEAELARQIPELNLERMLRSSDRSAVATRLPENSCLVEFVRCDIFDFQANTFRGDSQWKPARYLAFILRAGKPAEVTLIDLGEAASIDRLVADFRGIIIREADHSAGRDMATRKNEPISYADGPGRLLRAAVFDPIASALHGCRRIYIAPDGELNRLPFEVLPAPDRKFVLDEWSLSYLSSGRDLIRFGLRPTGEQHDPLIIADPDFDFGLNDRRKSDVPATIDNFPAKGPFQKNRSLREDLREAECDQPGFIRLPGSRKEGERIGQLLGVSPWLDRAALKGRLKTECHSPSILHLATHSFFLGDQRPDPPIERGPLDLLDTPAINPGSLPQLHQNPMWRCGLALAGANAWLQNIDPPAAAEDGLLTAEDVLGLDLLNTELVVVSACNTGLGEIRTGEGVFGLRRAFVLAGAKTLVMSLWKVPDEQTREYMEELYTRLLAGRGRAEALRETQLAMRMKYPEPYYWGSFICQGNPAPLDRPPREVTAGPETRSLGATKSCSAALRF